MNISINPTELAKLKMSPNQYCFLFCVFHDLESTFIQSNELGYLEMEGYVKIGERVELREKANQLFQADTSEAQFLEFWTNYPINVPNGSGGKRVLRSKDHESKEATECKKKYLALIKKPGEHEKILKGLRNYIKNQHPYIAAVPAFLNQRIYEKYYDVDVDETKKGLEGKTML